MSIRLNGDTPLADQVRSIVATELRAARDELREPGVLGLEVTVRDVRRRVRRVRSLLRLVRPAMDGGFGRADTALRDALHGLSPLRDAHALSQTFETAVTAARHEVDGVDRVRALLTLRAKRVATGGDLERLLSAAGERIGAVADAAEGWTFADRPSFPEIALGETYRRGRAAYRGSRDAATDDVLHAWRRAARRGRDQARLLEGLAPSALGPMAKSLNRLGDALGDDHDLAVLRAAVVAEHDPSLDAVVTAIDAIRADLRDRALRLGARLYAERPKAFAHRIRAYRRADRSLGAERSVGGLRRLSEDAADRPPAAPVPPAATD